MSGLSGHMFRTRFRQQIVADFLPPSCPRKTQRLIILCGGMPSIPRKQSLSESLAAKSPTLRKERGRVGPRWR
jgi:hypothetical protein